jgi:hypothetical protein
MKVNNVFCLLSSGLCDSLGGLHNQHLALFAVYSF